MRSVEEIKGRCRVDEDTGHWIWTGATSGNPGEVKIPRICAPDYSRREGAMVVQAGRRAVWHCLTGEPIPSGWKVYRVCDQALCLNPNHMRCGPDKQIARHAAKVGRYKDKPRRIASNRILGRARSKLTPELLVEIRSSSESGIAIAKRLGVSDTLISRVRLGQTRSHEALGGLFSGLVGRHA